MGNCLKKTESASEWGGEEWGFLNSKPIKPAPAPSPSIETESRKRRRRENKSKKVRFDAHVEVFGGEYVEESELKVDEEKKESKVGMEQVRIRITKKQLEELLGKVELESVSVHEMMSSLMKGHLIEPQQDDHGHKSWRPIATTVPELSDSN